MPGTLIGVYFLVTWITGPQLLGAQTYVQNLFYGGALVEAAVFSQLARWRRLRRASASLVKKEGGLVPLDGPRAEGNSPG